MRRGTPFPGPEILAFPPVLECPFIRPGGPHETHPPLRGLDPAHGRPLAGPSAPRTRRPGPRRAPRISSGPSSTRPRASWPFRTRSTSRASTGTASPRSTRTAISSPRSSSTSSANTASTNPPSSTCPWRDRRPGTRNRPSSGSSSPSSARSPTSTTSRLPLLRECDDGHDGRARLCRAGEPRGVL